MNEVLRQEKKFFRGIEVEKDTRIQDRYIPEHDRLGMTFTGWYADAGLTEEWDFSADQVNDNMTLYAGYEYDPSYLERDENGDIVYNNVNVQVWNAMHAFKVPNAPLQQLADDFNRLYEGQITVTITTDTTENPDGSTTTTTDTEKEWNGTATQDKPTVTDPKDDEGNPVVDGDGFTTTEISGSWRAGSSSRSFSTRQISWGRTSRSRRAMSRMALPLM